MLQNKLLIIFVFALAFLINQPLADGQTPIDAARKVSPSADAGKLFQEGWNLIQQKKYKEAADTFEKVVQIDPMKRNAYTNLSWMYLELGRYGDAAETARKEIENHPEISMAHNNLGFALTQLGKYDEAYIELKKAVELDPDNTKAHNNLGFAYRSAGRYPDALSVF